VKIEPMMRCDGVLVVFDGPARLRWRRTGPDRWTPYVLWPDQAQAEEMNAVLGRGEPVLIVLDLRAEPVYLLAEELAAAPPEIASLVRTLEGGVADLRIPRLAWLPDQLRLRGQRFLRDALDLVAATPAPLVAPVLLEPFGDAPRSVRFALCTGPVGWSRADLSAMVAHTFTRRRAGTRALDEGISRWSSMAHSTDGS
jgi:hypothetical protein